MCYEIREAINKGMVELKVNGIENSKNESALINAIYVK